MNHLKTYEAYFSGLSVCNISDEEIRKLIGVDKTDIQDLLVDLEDKLPSAHISITFFNSHNNDNSILDEIEYKNGIPFSNITGEEIKEIEIQIIFYPNIRMMNSANIRSKNSNFNGWYDLVVGDIDIEEELNSFEKRLKLLGFKDIKVSKIYNKYVIDKILNFTVYKGGLPEGDNLIGLSFLIIGVKKSVANK